MNGELEIGRTLLLWFWALCLAGIEIEIEGGYGWAERLPTWFLRRGRVGRVYGVFMGRRPLTGYHVFAFAIPLPGGIGGLDLGLLGALVLYGVNATDAAVAILAYRGLLLAVPAAVGLPALAVLRRRLRREDHDIRACVPGQEVDVLGAGRVRMGPPVARAAD